MDARVPQILLLLILNSRKSDQAFLKEVHKQWVEGRNCHVQAQVALEAIHQKRRLNVPTDEGALVAGHLVHLRHQVDALPLRGGHGLHDPYPALPQVRLTKVTMLSGQHEARRNKIEEFEAKLTLHAFDVQVKTIFACQFRGPEVELQLL